MSPAESAHDRAERLVDQLGEARQRIKDLERKAEAHKKLLRQCQDAQAGNLEKVARLVTERDNALRDLAHACEARNGAVTRAQELEKELRSEMELRPAFMSACDTWARCSWCGWEHKDQPGAVAAGRAHVARCPLHPMNVAKAERDQYRLAMGSALSAQKWSEARSIIEAAMEHRCRWCNAAWSECACEMRLASADLSAMKQAAAAFDAAVEELEKP